MRQIKQLSDYFPIDKEGIFTAFINPVWVVDLPDSEELDTYFMLNYGEKLGNKLVDFYADDTDGTVKGDKLYALAKMVYNLNSVKWSHLYDVYKAEYNPIENTDFVETINNTGFVDSRTTGESTANGSANTATNGSTTGNNTSDSDVYGFNSATAVGDSKLIGNTTDTTNSTSNTTNNNFMHDENTKYDINNHNSTHKKHGNIGVTSTTELMQGTVDFWKWSFVDQVCKDICNIIALSIY